LNGAPSPGWQTFRTQHERCTIHLHSDAKSTKDVHPHQSVDPQFGREIENNYLEVFNSVTADGEGPQPSRWHGDSRAVRGCDSYSWARLGRDAEIGRCGRHNSRVCRPCVDEELEILPVYPDGNQQNAAVGQPARDTASGRQD